MKTSAAARPLSRPTGARKREHALADTLLPLLPRVIVLLLAVFGVLFSVVTCYRLTVLPARTVWTALAFCTLFTAIFASKRRGALLLICLLPTVIIVWRSHDALLQSLLTLVDSALSPLDLMLPDAFRALLLPHDAQETALFATKGLQALLFPMTLLAAYAVVARRSLPLLALATLPLLLPAPFFSLSPATVPFFCLVAAFFTLFVGNIEKLTPLIAPRPEGAPGLTCPPDTQPPPPPSQRLLPLAILPVVALAVLLASALLPENGYARPRKIEALQEEILSWDVGGSGFRSNDGLTHGNLQNLSDIHFSGETALKIQLSENRPLYLRDFAGVRYTSGGWDGASNADYARYTERASDLAPQNLRAAAFPSSARYTLSVRNVAAPASSLWIPNGLSTTADLVDGAAYRQDTALDAPGANVPAYTVEAVTCEPSLFPFPSADTLESAYLSAANSALSQAGSPAQAQSAANAYIDYIFDAYTALPTEALRAAETLCARYGLALHSENGQINTFATCRDLYELLSSRCTYAYSPPHIPPDADFVTYFIEESRAGYCVHFATAATVLLRALGVPARYAEGYIVIRADYGKEPDTEGYIDIEDTHAHAWVEVFDPVQLEWIPVEMTASASGGQPPAANGGENGSDNAASPTPSPTPTPVPTPEPTPEPTPDPNAGETPEPSANPTDEPETTGDPDQSGSALGNVTPTPEPGADSGPEDGDPTDSEADDPESDDAPDADSEAPDAEEPMPPQETPPPPEAPPPLPPPPLWPFLVLAGLVLLVLAAYLFREAMRRRRRRAVFSADMNAGMLALCGLAMRMLRFAGFPPLLPLASPEDYVSGVADRLPPALCDRLCALLTLARRARFSNVTCTKREREESLACLHALMQALSGGLPRVRGALLRYLYPDIRRKS